MQVGSILGWLCAVGGASGSGVMTETFFCESYMTCTAGDMFRSHYREHMVFF